MTEGTELLPQPPPRQRTGTIGVLVIIALALIIVSGVILIGFQTNTTGGLVQRGDCRARFQGNFDGDLADLVAEATQPNSDPAKLTRLALQLQVDAKSYKACTPDEAKGNTDGLP